MADVIAMWEILNLILIEVGVNLCLTQADVIAFVCQFLLADVIASD